MTQPVTPQAKLDAIQALAQGAGGSYLFGGAWQPGTISAADVCAILDVEPPQPPPPLTEEESAELSAAIAEVRAKRTGSTMAGDRS